MKKKWLATLVFGSALMLGACGGDDSATDTETDTNTGETTESVETVAQQRCATCHGGQLQGASAPALDKIGSKYSEEEILNIIENGTDKGMPGGLVKGEDAEALAAWLAEKK